MYSKIFSQIFESSIAANPEVRRLFMELLVLADKNGVIDKTYEAIARILGIPTETVITGIKELMQPDSESRSPEFGGARLVLLGPERKWGWRVVNYRKYRNRQYDDTDNRRAYQREWIKRKRRQASTDVDSRRQASTNVDNASTEPSHNTPNGSNLPSRHPVDCRPKAEAEAEANTQGNNTLFLKGEGADSNKSNRHQQAKLNGLSDSEWLARIAANKTYSGINVQREFGKMAAWCKEARKLPTRRRFVAWLNRIEVLAQVEEAEEENLGPEGWRAAAKALFPSMQFPESFWDIQSPEVMQKIKERLANG